MPKQRGRYYLSRVIKLGTLTQETLIAAILNAPVRNIGKFDWAITDVRDGRNENPSYVFGKLAKYSSEGHVIVVDPSRKSQVEALAPNLLVASSPFVYLPEFSGLAYLHVWNGIQEDSFAKRFATLIQAAYENFFVECSVEPVADYREFIQKLRGLQRITEMSAKVHPPNPLFGHLWGSLKDYIQKRNAEEVAVREKKTDGPGLHTEIVKLMEGLLAQGGDPSTPTALHVKTPDITDAAMLMAADGYGQGKIIGEQDGDEIVIRTADTHKSFLFSKEPDPSGLAKAAASNFKQVSDERGMTH
jgi:hypothetical protein